MSRKEKRELEEQEKKGGIGKVILTIFIILILLAVIAAGIVYMWYTSSLKPVNTENTENIAVEIEAGTGTVGIAQVLKQNNLIHDEMAFKIYCKLNKVNNVQAGKYEFNQSMSVEEIIKYLQTGKVIVTEINIMFPEGKNMRSIAKTIESKTNLSYDEIMEVFASKEYAKELIGEYWFLTDEILAEDIYYPLEGYLYPDTYTFESVDVSLDTIIKTLLNQTDKVLSQYQVEIEAKGYTIHQFLTLASVVENEGLSTKDRKGIAAVFLNRMKKNMPLQSDVTTYYAFKIDMGERDLTAKELNTYNKYNTRGPNMEGLIPIGPISNVSESSIEATLNPLDSTAIFFVADKNGKVYFTSTNAEHEKVIQDLKNQGLWYTYE